MWGAIVGDVVGSRFEFDRGGKTKDFHLFTQECCFTDDSVMAVAVADGLIKGGSKDDIIQSMLKWGRKYPNAGYGQMFLRWLATGGKEPYNSFGNGSAMRVAAAGWLYDTLKETQEMARRTAEVSHNHPEGIKGAECTATVIFMGRRHADKDFIRDYVTDVYGYELSTVDELRKKHEHIETCMDSMPKALTAFFEGNDFEDVIRNAVSLGGDTDTLGAIAGAMAEGFYGVPERIKKIARRFITDEMVKVVEEVEEWNV